MWNVVLAVASMALGAIVALVASRISQASSRSTSEYSSKVLELALAHLSSAEKENQRQQVTRELVETVGRLDTTVGNIFAQMHRQNRTIITKPITTGELPPRRPGEMQEVQQGPLPPEGLDDEETVPPRLAAKERERVLGAAT